MNKSYSKIRHIQEANMVLEKRVLSDNEMSRFIKKAIKESVLPDIQEGDDLCDILCFRKQANFGSNGEVVKLIQNALVKADKISGFNWDGLEFSDDINVLNNNNIIVNNQAPTVYINKIKELNYNEKNNQIECDENNHSEITDETDGWTTVITDKGQMVRRKILKKIGFLPNTKFKNNNKEKNTEKNNIKTDIPKVLVI